MSGCTALGEGYGPLGYIAGMSMCCWRCRCAEESYEWGDRRYRWC